jgi:hypothetical protein
VSVHALQFSSAEALRMMITVTAVSEHLPEGQCLAPPARGWWRDTGGTVQGDVLCYSSNGLSRVLWSYWADDVVLELHGRGGIPTEALWALLQSVDVALQSATGATP